MARTLSPGELASARSTPLAALMSALALQELRPGLVVHLDTAVLRRLGGSTTNAERRAGGDRAVHGPHYFLLLDAPDPAGLVTAVPLFSRPAPGSEPLDARRKRGALSLWQQAPSWYSRWQHWRIPTHALVAASAGELTTAADRCRYADDDPDALHAIARWAARNRAPWRAV